MVLHPGDAQFGEFTLDEFPHFVGTVANHEHHFANTGRLATASRIQPSTGRPATGKSVLCVVRVSGIM